MKTIEISKNHFGILTSIDWNSNNWQDVPTEEDLLNSSFSFAIENEVTYTFMNFGFDNQLNGDNLHSQWTDNEEKLILPILVSNGYKPVSTIASSKKNSFNNIIIPNNCDSLIMWILIIYLKKSFTYNELEELVNETNSYTKRGYMLGYGNATIKE